MTELADLRMQFVGRIPNDQWFVVCVRPASPNLDSGEFARDVAEKAGLPKAVCMVGTALAVAVAVSDPARVAVSADGRRMALRFGELHGPTAVEPAGLAESRAALCPAEVRSLNGSWSLFRFDADRDDAVFVTDRLNSRRVFAGFDGAFHWFSSSLSLHPGRGGPLDLVALGWYLTHGAIYGGRTPYQAVRVLPASGVHRIGSGGISSERYWTPNFSRRRVTGGDAKRLETVFGDLLIDSVRCRATGPEPLWISLSAGYDAAGIAGILGERLRRPGVRCFSYARGTHRGDSDEAISSDTARLLGYPHETLLSYRGDYASWLEANARACAGMAGLCDEVDAWATLTEQTRGQHATILVGDECLGWTDYALAEPADALRAAQIQGGPHLASVARLFDPATCDHIVAGIESDIHDMLAEAPRFDDLHDLKDYFYTTQRAPNYILPWRANFASRAGNVRFPLLDSRILDFMATVPASLRRQKALYRRTISRLCPATFSLPRARSASYPIDHATELAGMASDQISLRAPLLAELVTPRIQEAFSAAVRSSAALPQRTSLFRKVVNAVKHTPLGDLLRKAQPAPPVRNASPAELIARLMCLDRSLTWIGSP
jgi:hypothetical protein